MVKATNKYIPFPVYMKIGGVLAVVATVSTGLFCIFAGLHCMMQINNKKICIGYQKNTLLAFITALVAGRKNS